MILKHFGLEVYAAHEHPNDDVGLRTESYIYLPAGLKQLKANNPLTDEYDTDRYQAGSIATVINIPKPPSEQLVKRFHHMIKTLRLLDHDDHDHISYYDENDHPCCPYCAQVDMAKDGASFTVNPRLTLLARCVTERQRPRRRRR